MKGGSPLPPYADIELYDHVRSCTCIKQDFKNIIIIVCYFSMTKSVAIVMTMTDESKFYKSLT